MPDDIDWDAIYSDRVHPAFAAPQGGQPEPRCVFVTGHQGSGKTTYLQRLLADLGPDHTQSIVPDALLARVVELHDGSPRAVEAYTAYRATHCATHCERLADHAVAQRSHILWERAIPGNIERLGHALRRLGYRVDCVVLATPVEESWIGTLSRSLAAQFSGDRSALRVGWSVLAETALRWPAVLDRVETARLFNRVAVLDRDGNLCFENHVIGPPDGRRWAETPFAFESLMVERARPRSDAALASLLASWEALHPRIAESRQPAWPDAELQAFDRHLRALVADPAARFDLDQPGPDPVVAAAWIARLGADLAAVRSSPEVRDQPGLATRAGRLITLVSEIAGQPIR